MPIPKLIHRIWLGPPMPQHLEAYGRTWAELNPDWEQRLWTEENMPPLRNQRLYDDADSIAPGDAERFRASVIRYDLLARFGGVYVDCDFECLQPIDAVLAALDCFAVWESDRLVCNGIFGATPGHPFTRALVAGLPANVAANRGASNGILAGPEYLTSTYRRFADSVTAFAPDLFFPYSFHELDRLGEDFPKAVAVHHWEHLRRQRRISSGRAAQPG
jgi:mannosyltransferase OCH1-like enzyme